MLRSIAWKVVVAALALLIGLSTACAKPVYHAGVATAAAPRAPDCQLRIAGTPPGPGFEEIGTITIEGDRSFGAGSFRDPNQFVARIRPEICAAGGEVVVTEVQEYGVITRGIVFRQVAFVPSGPPPGACAPICSPGFECVNGVCIPLCNPPCVPGAFCGQDRLCHFP